MKNSSYDVIIIGSGAGGGACAWALSSRGVSVLVLEAGPAYDPARDYHLDKPDWEQVKFPYKAGSQGKYSFGPLQKLEPRWQDLRSWNHITGKMNSSDTQRRPWKYHHVRGLGGTTLGYAGEAHRLNPGAMQMKTRFGVAADWPLSYADLEPFYCIAEEQTGVAGPDHDAVRYRSKPYPLPPHRLSYASRMTKTGCDKLGLSWVPNSVAILSRPRGGRPRCNYCGNCSHGCPISDKGSVDVTFMRRALASGHCRVETGARVTMLEPDKQDKVAAIHYQDESGAEKKISCRSVVVSCGSIETPRLLLLSKNVHAPEGLANESGQVGRNFMETLSWASSGIFPEPLDSYRGIPVDSICWDFNAPDAVPGNVGGFRLSPMTLEAGLVGPISYATRVVDGWGRSHKQRMRELFGRVLAVGAVGESLPNKNSFIDLDPDKKDATGNPVARINSFLDDTELKRLELMAMKSREILQASGIEKIFEEYGTYDVFSSTHVFGTCRMGIDPEQSVVDSFCRSHRWRNLFVADNSVFPSSGGGEAPTLTIEALAIRTGFHISDLLARREL